jgi:hypothetical protein
MSKVFRDFQKTNHMKKGPIIGIAVSIGIFMVILSIIFVFNQESNVTEVKDTFDKEIQSVEIPEIQEKLNEIQRIANNTSYKPLPREWITSGPFQIDRSDYAIGEKIFIKIGGLGFDEKGQVIVWKPQNEKNKSPYLTIPFDGAKKSGFNYYIEPQLSKTRGLCSIDDIMGEWTLVFRGTNYPNLNFEIIERVVPGTNTESVC